MKEFKDFLDKSIEVLKNDGYVTWSDGCNTHYHSLRHPHSLMYCDGMCKENYARLIDDMMQKEE